MWEVRGTAPSESMPLFVGTNTCQKCFKTGHKASHCRGVPLDDKAACKCCGETGHYKRECPLNSNPCERCHIKGHTIAVCKRPPGFAPKAKQQSQQQQPQQKTGPNRAQQQLPPAGAIRCEVCGPDNAHEYKWICESCGCLVKDDGDAATKCPGCFCHKGGRIRKPSPLLRKTYCPK